jgi:hypothetical protein
VGHADLVVGGSRHQPARRQARSAWRVADPSRVFSGDDLVAIMQPRVHEVTYMDVTHIYQRRASCCRIYLLPQKELCASCPLVSQEERLERNRAWMKTQIERENTPLAGHT